MATNLTLTDATAFYNWSKTVNDNAVRRISIDDTNLVTECDQAAGYYLCAQDASFNTIHAFMQSSLVDPSVLKEAATVQIADASVSLPQMGDQVSASLQPLGFKMASPVRVTTRPQSVIYDDSNGKDPKTVKWLSSFFHASVVTPQAGTTPTPGPPQGGVVVVLGRDYSVRWVGETG